MPYKLSLTKDQADFYLSEIFNILKDKKTYVFLKCLNIKNAGECERGDPRFIWLDPAEDILTTLIHEALHLIYEDKLEREVKMLEWNIYCHLSDDQTIKLLNILNASVNRSKRHSKLRNSNQNKGGRK